MRGILFFALASVAGAGLLACGSNADMLSSRAPRPRAMQAHAEARRAVAFTRLGDARQGSTVALARLAGRDVAIVADADAAELRVVDLATRTETGAVKLPGVPGQLVVTGDGRIVVALRENGLLGVYRPDGESLFAEVALVPTADEPIDLAITPDDRTVLVSCGIGRRVQGFSLSGSLARTLDVRVAREPRAIVVSDDGAKAFVSHIAGGTMTVVDLKDASGSGELALKGIEEELFVERAVPPPILARQFIDFAIPEPSFEQSAGTRKAAQGFALAKVHAGKTERILGPEVMVNPGFPTVRTLGYGGGVGESVAPEAADVAVVDARTLEVSPISLHMGGDGFDLRRQGGKSCILPRAAIADDARGALYVACAGIDSIVEYDARADNPSNTERRRWSVGAGPSGVALDAAHARLVVWSQLDHALGLVPLEKGDVQKVALEPAADVQPATVDVQERGVGGADVALGRKLFDAEGDARISADGRACASCHPDGRDDGNVWSTPDGPRQTPMLAGRLRGTAPYGWYGASDTVAKHVEINSLHRLNGTGLPPRELAALAAYVTSLRGPMRAPGGGLDAQEARGRDIFMSEQAGCSSCHVAGDGSFTDGDRHDVGSSAEADVDPRFDTPSLRFVDDGAPYFHDGRYADLHELLVKSDGKMGHTAQLSPEDLAALEAYLRTI